MKAIKEERELFFLCYILDICGALRDLVPFVQFKKREKHPWRSVSFSKVAGFKPGTKWYQIAQRTTYIIHWIILFNEYT